MTRLILLALLSLLLTIAATAAAQEEVRKIEYSYDPADAGLFHVLFSLGDVRIEGTDGDFIDAAVHIECSNEDFEACRNAAQKMDLISRRRKAQLRLRLKSTNLTRIRGLKARMLVRVPRHLPLEVSMQAGDVAVHGMQNDVEIDGKVGNADISYPESEAGLVRVNIGLGSAKLWVGDGLVSGTGFPKTIKWQGTGQRQVSVGYGSGDVEIRLEGSAR